MCILAGVRINAKRTTQVNRWSSVRCVQNMDVNQTSYCTLLDRQGQSKFICYTLRKNDVFSICLTDADNVWSTDYTEDMLSEPRWTFASKSTEDFVLKFRSACGRGDMSVVVHDTCVELSAGPDDPTVTLSRLEAPQATKELKELLFRMADSLSQPERNCAPPPVSPMKYHQRRITEFEPRQQQGCTPSVTLKKRPAGASLINPGTKKKLQATGVSFDNADED
uniref:PAXX non-homologous end joining factor n=1 Tax=Mola mola TaxID=94237 RepID=A0A3Q3WAA7_MOLML